MFSKHSKYASPKYLLENNKEHKNDCEILLKYSIGENQKQLWDHLFSTSAKLNKK